jgi:cell division protein ZapA
MKRPVDVKIMGQTFTVTSEEGEEHIRTVAALVDAKMRELSNGPRVVATAQVAILAALNIASEYQKLKEEQEVVRNAIDRMSSRVIGSLKD